MKNLPNIGKPVPEPTDPALIKPVSDAIEAVDGILGAPASALTTTAKTIVPAINELETNVSSLVEGVCGTKHATTVAGQSWFQDNLAYPAGYNQNNCNVFITPMATPYGYAVLPYGVIKQTTSVQIKFAVRDGASIATAETFPYAYLFAKL